MDHISHRSDSDKMPRRSFFGALMAVCTACIGAVLAIPLVRAALFPLRDAGSQDAWSDLGPVENFAGLTAPVTQPVGIERRDGWELVTAREIVYVVAGPGGQPRVLSSTCPHLGCTVQWHADKDEFICPCHRSTFGLDGSLISGAAARGMDAFPARVQDGRLYIQFQNYRQLLATKETVD